MTPRFGLAFSHRGLARVPLVLYGAARSRAAVAEADGDLERVSVEPDRRTGGHFILRWILIQMVEATARHDGHIDLIRAAIDGSTGPVVGVQPNERVELHATWDSGGWLTFGE